MDVDFQSILADFGRGPTRARYARQLASLGDLAPTAPALRAWLDVGRGARTNRVNALRAFARWAQARGIVGLESTLCRPLARPKVIRGAIPLPLSVEQVAAVIAAAPSLRDRALVEVLYATAARLVEVCALDREDVTNCAHGLGRARVRGRCAWLGRRALETLIDYLRARAFDHEALLLGDDGARLKPSAAHRILARVGRAALGRPITGRRLREAAAVHMLDRGAGLRVVQTVLGLKSVRSVLRYEAASITELVRAYRAHPMASWGR